MQPVREQLHKLERELGQTSFECVVETNGPLADELIGLVEGKLKSVCREAGVSERLLQSRINFVGSTDAIFFREQGKICEAYSEVNGSNNRGFEISGDGGLAIYIDFHTSVAFEAVKAALRRGEKRQAVLVTTPNPFAKGNITQGYHLIAARLRSKVVEFKDRGELQGLDLLVEVRDHQELVNSGEIRFKNNKLYVVGKSQKPRLLTVAYEGLLRRLESDSNPEYQAAYNAYISGCLESEVIGPADPILTSKFYLQEAIEQLVKKSADELESDGFSAVETGEVLAYRRLIIFLGSRIKHLPSYNLNLVRKRRSVVREMKAALDDLLDGLGLLKDDGLVDKTKLEPEVLRREIVKASENDLRIKTYAAFFVAGIKSVLLRDNEGKFDFFLIKPDKGSGGAGIRFIDQRTFPDGFNLEDYLTKEVLFSTLNFYLKMKGNIPGGITIQQALEKPLLTQGTYRDHGRVDEKALGPGRRSDNRIYIIGRKGELPRFTGGLFRVAAVPDDGKSRPALIVNLSREREVNGRIKTDVELWRGLGFSRKVLSYIGLNQSNAEQEFVDLVATSLVVYAYLLNIYFPWWQKRFIRSLS